MAKPKIFVGTMYNGENEFHKMMNSLQSQINVEIVHFLTFNKPEILSTKELYGKWSSIKNEFDAFVQLDPDTIITKQNSLELMYSILKENEIKGCNSIQCPLYDHLTMTKIWGLNMYLPSVEFIEPNKEGYCDRSTTNVKLVEVNNLLQELNPVGDHCFDTHYCQAFHFGLQRGIKNRVEQHISVIQSFIKTNDDRRAMAALGFEMSKSFPRNKSSSYHNQEFKDFYVKACQVFSEYKKSLIK